MAAAVSIVKRVKFGNEFAVIADITFDDSYPTGGESVTPEQLGLKVVDVFYGEGRDGYFFEYLKSTEKLLVRVPVSLAAAAVVAGANNTIVKAAATDTIEISGTGSALQIPAAQVTATTDLSAVVCRGIFFGW